MSVTREQVEKLMFEASQMEGIVEVIVANRRIFGLLLDERLVALNPVTQAKAEALLKELGAAMKKEDRRQEWKDAMNEIGLDAGQNERADAAQAGEVVAALLGKAKEAKDGEPEG